MRRFAQGSEKHMIKTQGEYYSMTNTNTDARMKLKEHTYGLS